MNFKEILLDEQKDDSGDNKEVISKLKGQYHVDEDDKFITMHIKSGDSFPYRFNKATMALAQGWQARAYTKMSFKQIKKFKSLDDAINFIIKKHNKSTSYMTHWKKI